MAHRFTSIAPILAVLTAACNGGPGAEVPGDRADKAPFHAVAADETVMFTGTEPFWNGQVAGDRLTYITPEDPGGTVVPVARFAGRGGLSFTGELAGSELVLAVTPGTCSDGMSDRTYPFTVTLRLGEELRQGCGWTVRQSWTGGE